MDIYSDYKQIPVYESDREKTYFMTEQANYQYNMMLFGLKSAGATYQRIKKKIFKEEIGETFEVYMDNMIVKFDK